MDNANEHHEMQPSLTGATVYLRPVAVEDLRYLEQWDVLSEPQSLTCRPWVFRTLEETIEAFKQRTVNDKKQSFAVCRKQDGKLVGSVQFFDLNPLNRSAEIGLSIDPAQRRQGLASEAVMLLVSYLFRYRGLNKVYGQTGGFNVATIALLEKLGFKRDAVLRDHYFLNGKFYPGYVYSLLAREIHSLT